jgi:predicted ABC-type exoprotein transport system permease subunit
MFNIGVGLLNSIGTVLGLKELPDEAALQAYIRNAFRGIFFLVLGTVLLGAFITACLYISYDELIYSGYAKTNAQIIILALVLVLAVISFILADIWISKKMCINIKSKGFLDEKIDYIKHIAGDSIVGFIEGLCNKSKCSKK